MEKFIQNANGDTVRLAPCHRLDHIARFEAGYAVVTCRDCVMELVPDPSPARPLRVLNAYAGIGGNRHLWPDDWQVTAIEIDPRVAAEYARRYPSDVVLIEDAHAFVMEHAHEFDAVWTSPPCPTHSRLALVTASIRGEPAEPDPRLLEEIEHLRALGGRYVVENVHTYYRPPIAPDLVSERHYYWTNQAALILTPPPAGLLTTRSRRPTPTQHAAAYGLPPVPRGALADSRTAIRNAVVPIEGLEVALAAFASNPGGS